MKSYFLRRPLSLVGIFQEVTRMSKFALFVSFLLTYLFSENSSSAAIREPAVAGSFYPADSAQLAKMVRGHLERVKSLPAIDGELLALIVPHAGLTYSGGIAAYSYKLLENSKVDKIILCGPSHRARFPGVSVYGPAMSWRTPLGVVICDDDLCNRLVKSDHGITVYEPAHAQEHCLEVQLPYLQTVLKNFQIVPLVMGSQDSEEIDNLAEALADLNLGSNAVMVASTDWQHYRPASEGHKMDSLGLDCLEHVDAERLEDYLESGRVEMCGGGPTVAIIKAARARGANTIKILKYGDSGDISGDKSAVVGYVAAAIYKSATKDNKERKTDAASSGSEVNSSYKLSDYDKAMLLRIARQSIESRLNDRPMPKFDVSDILSQPGAAFVTLTEDDMLRGCIGYTVARGPLFEVVSECAVQAAVSDPRFAPVRRDEVSKLHIEISVLTPLQETKSLDEIEVGRDGLMISLGGNRGLLLPQVATEYGWDRTEFLEQTCRKAGLPKDSYKHPEAVIYRFQALIFGELP